jgi:hypothetical protein
MDTAGTIALVLMLLLITAAVITLIVLVILLFKRQGNTEDDVEGVASSVAKESARADARSAALRSLVKTERLRLANIAQLSTAPPASLLPPQPTPPLRTVEGFAKREAFLSSEGFLSPPPPPIPPPPGPAQPSDWMYLTDATGAEYLRGGLAAASTWLRDGVQMPSGGCVKEVGAGTQGSSVCFGNGGSGGGEPGALNLIGKRAGVVGQGMSSFAGPRRVRVWDQLEAGGVSAKTFGVVGSGASFSAAEDGTADEVWLTGADGTPTSLVVKGTLASEGGIGTLGDIYALGSTLTMGDAVNFGDSVTLGNKVTLGNSVAMERMGSASDVLAGGIVGAVGGVYSLGERGSSPLAARGTEKNGVLIDPTIGDQGTGYYGLLDDAQGSLSLVAATGAPSIRLAFGDAASSSEAVTVGPSGSIESAAMSSDPARGTWLRSPTLVSSSPWATGSVALESSAADSAATGAGVRLGGGNSSSWRLGVLQDAGSDRFVLERNQQTSAPSPYLTASAFGVGIMVPAGQDPGAALDVRGDARVTGQLCVGASCVGQSEFESLGSMQSRFATLPAMQAQIDSLPAMRAQIDALPAMQTQIAALPAMQTQIDSLPVMRTQIAELQEQLRAQQQQAVAPPPSA